MPAYALLFEIKPSILALEIDLAALSQPPILHKYLKAMSDDVCAGGCGKLRPEMGIGA
jgi:hypothetical protein